MVGLLILGFILYMAYLEISTSVENWLDCRRFEKQLKSRK